MWHILTACQTRKGYQVQYIFLFYSYIQEMSATTPTPLSATLRVGVVGCGQIVEHHVTAMLPHIRSGRIIVHVLVDPRAARMNAIRMLLSVDQEERPIEMSSLPELLAATPPPVDAVLIAVPHDLHEEVATLALRAGLHVLCEKPQRK